MNRPDEGTVSGAGKVEPASPPARRAAGLHRLADGFALALIAGGVVLFFYARYRLQLLAADQITRVEGHWAVEQFVRFHRLSNAGLWISGVGLLLATGLALWQWRRRAAARATAS